MTTIVASKSMMAADTQVTTDEITFDSPKIFKFYSPLFKREIIAGAAGDGVGCVKFIDALMKDEEIDDEDLKETCGLVATGNTLLYYDFCFTPMVVSNEYYAIGVGAQTALAFADYGHPLDEAIRAAMHRAISTGGEITILELK